MIHMKEFASGQRVWVKLCQGAEWVWEPGVYYRLDGLGLDSAFQHEVLVGERRELIYFKDTQIFTEEEHAAQRLTT